MAPPHKAEMPESLQHYPQRPGEPDCAYFVRNGFCAYRAHCRFNHPPLATTPGMAVLQTVINEEKDCNDAHALDTSEASRRDMAVGLPVRMGEPECSYYVRTGYCWFGSNCKFHHPQPVTWNPSSPLPSSPLCPSGDLAPVSHLTWGMPTWLVRRYLPMGSRASTSASYIPAVAYPPQWSPYGGAVTYLGASVTPQQKPGQSQGIEGMIHLHKEPRCSTTFSHHDPLESNFPQRPGEPDCQYYLKTGDCKFGSSCKFHHPPDKAASLLPYSLNAMGLPLRPGQPVCSFYVRHGICKFGQVCKYDHPHGQLVYAAVPGPVLGSTGACSSRSPSERKASSPNTLIGSPCKTSQCCDAVPQACDTGSTPPVKVLQSANNEQGPCS